MESAAEKASKDISSAENKYNQAIKLSVRDTEKVITPLGGNFMDLKLRLT